MSAELKRMKKALDQAKKKPKIKRKSAPTRPAPRVSKKLISQLSREADRAWGLPRGQRTRTSRYGSLSSRLSSAFNAGVREAKKLGNTAVKPIKSTGSKIVSANRKAGRYIDSKTGGRIGSRGNTDYILPSIGVAAYATNKVRKGVKYLTNAKYRVEQSRKKLKKQQKRTAKQLIKLEAQEIRLANKLAKVEAALADAKLMEKTAKAAKKSGKRALRRGRGFGGFRPVVYTPVAARAQQQLVVPCSGAYWV